MSHHCTEQRFLGDVANHEMIVIRDEGLHRHIRFKQPRTSNMFFDLITWPGHLCYTGDMGTYVFQRLEDMFEFFRTDREHARPGRQLAINLSYWTEKLVAVDGGCHGGKVKEFDEDKFKRVVNEYRVNWMREAKNYGWLDKEGRRELWDAVESDVMDAQHDGGDRALYAAYDFSHSALVGGRRPHIWAFDDLFEKDFTEYTHSMVWCCYALAWGIQKYDQAKAEASATAEALA